MAISVDVTERLKEQKQLREAKKKLSQYSRQLEELVKQRSMEIDAILRYTPSIIYLKDKQLRYKLVNPGFEKLFQVSNEWIQGKQDAEVLPKEIAIQRDSHTI
ncbi:PAS domain-containing protein [Desulfonauticus submarinus]